MDWGALLDKVWGEEEGRQENEKFEEKKTLRLDTCPVWRRASVELCSMVGEGRVGQHTTAWVKARGMEAAQGSTR